MATLAITEETLTLERQANENFIIDYCDYGFSSFDFKAVRSRERSNTR